MKWHSAILLTIAILGLMIVVIEAGPAEAQYFVRLTIAIFGI
jgi:hypothetical protein